KFLLTQGYQKIGCITGLLKMSSARERVDGYLAALKEYGVATVPEWIVHGDYSMQSGLIHANILLEHGVDSIFACNDMMAIGVSKALQLHGKKAGRDFGLVGFDNSPICEYLETPLTTIDQNIYDMGKAACRLAITSINEKGKPQPLEKKRVQFQPSLIIRETANHV
ncbi:MAG: substrate-binding domain-containing protein, partial [Ruthenibacterium sp.]